jgi:hypothetical protein
MHRTQVHYVVLGRSFNHQGHHPVSITNSVSHDVESNTTQHARHEVSVVGVERLKTFAPGMLKKLELSTAYEKIGHAGKKKAPIARE